MASKGATRLINKRLNPLSALINSRKIAKLLGFPWLKLAVGIMLSGVQNSIRMARMAIGFDAFKAGTMDGDNENGVLPIGQVTGIMHDTPSVKTVMDRIVKEAAEAGKKLGKKL